MKKNKNAIVIIVVIAVLVVFQYRYLQPKSASLKEKIGSRHALLEKYEKLVRKESVIETEVKDTQKSLKELDQILIEEKSEYLATAKIQETVSGYARRAGIVLVRSRPLKPVEMNRYRNIPIYYEGNGKIRQVADFLQLIEKGTPVLKIEKLGLNITNVQDPKELKMAIQISGLIRS